MLIFEKTKNSKGTLKRIAKERITPKAEHTEILRLFNEGTSKEEIIKKYPDIQWVIMENSIYDISGFSHPGGSYLTNNLKIRGRDISRYLYGGQMLEEYGGKVQGNEHSEKALVLLETFKIGDITVSEEKGLVKREMNVDP